MSAPRDWSRRVREALEAEREAGVTDFHAAWRAALAAHPVPRMFEPPIRATLFCLPGDDDQEESVSEFTYRVFEREWRGDVPPARRLLGDADRMWMEVLG